MLPECRADLDHIKASLAKIERAVIDGNGQPGLVTQVSNFRMIVGGLIGLDMMIVAGLIGLWLKG